MAELQLITFTVVRELHSSNILFVFAVLLISQLDKSILTNFEHPKNISNKAVALLVLNDDKFREVKLSEYLNRAYIDVTCDVLKLFKLIDCKAWQPENVQSIFLMLLVSQLFKLRLVKLSLPSNIKDISVTLLVSKLLRSRLVNL